jgi:hypothetical protein
MLFFVHLNWPWIYTGEGSQDKNPTQLLSSSSGVGYEEPFNGVECQVIIRKA